MTRSATPSAWCSVNAPRLPEHRVDQRGLAVVDVRDDRDVAEVCAGGHESRFRGSRGVCRSVTKRQPIAHRTCRLCPIVRVTRGRGDVEQGHDVSVHLRPALPPPPDRGTRLRRRRPTAPRAHRRRGVPGAPHRAAAAPRATSGPRPRAAWTVHTAEHGTALPGRPARTTGQPGAGTRRSTRRRTASRARSRCSPRSTGAPRSTEPARR